MIIIIMIHVISTSPPNAPPIIAPTGVSSSLLYYYSDLKLIYVTIQLLTQLEQWILLEYMFDFLVLP